MVIPAATPIRKRARKPDQKNARKAAILTAAREMWSEHGYFQLTMSNLATRCGLAKGTLYLYFETKEDLFLTILLDDFRSWKSYYEAEVARPESDRTATLLSTLEEYPDLIRLFGMLGSVLSAPQQGESGALAQSVLTEIHSLDPLLDSNAATVIALISGGQNLRSFGIDVDLRITLRRLLGHSAAPVPALEPSPSPTSATSSDSGSAQPSMPGQWIRRY